MVNVLCSPTLHTIPKIIITSLALETVCWKMIMVILINNSLFLN